MLSLIFILFVIGFVFFIVKGKKNSRKFEICIVLLWVVLILSSFYAFFILIFVNSNSYNKEITKLESENKQLEYWSESLKNHSADDEPYPSDHVTDFLDNQISDNEEKISHYNRCLELVPKCRWLLYFG